MTRELKASLRPPAPVIRTCPRAPLKRKPPVGAIEIDLSGVAPRPAVIVIASDGRPAPTPLSDSREMVGRLWTLQVNATPRNARLWSSAVTSTVERPADRGRPVIRPVEGEIERPDGSCTAA